MALSITREGWFEPHIQFDVFAAFFRDNIKRVIISGTRLPQGRVIQNLPAKFDKSDTYVEFTLCVRENVVGFSLIEACKGSNLPRWEKLDRFLHAEIMGGETSRSGGHSQGQKAR